MKEATSIHMQHSTVYYPFIYCIKSSFQLTVFSAIRKYSSQANDVSELTVFYILFDCIGTDFH